jgi:acetoin utilization deacetylase AcuC-like enzyme
MQIFHSENYPIVLPEGHHFPIQKYALVREQLVFEGVIKKSQLQSPELIEEETILLTHEAAFWSRARNLQLTTQESRRIGFPQCEELIARSIASASGTVGASLSALESGAGMNLAGGTHHAFFDRGEGFCLLNDIAISINYLLQKGAIRRALVVDLDVHQGNGTAALFQNRPEVFTFSMHCGDNYPFWKEQSDLDIELPGDTGDEAYLGILQKQIPRLFEEVKPDIVYYLAGVDVLAGDRLGRLGLSAQGCYERDKWVISQCHSYLLPLVIVMGGGYHTSLNQLVRAHAATFRLGIEYYEKSNFYISR